MGPSSRTPRRLPVLLIDDHRVFTDLVGLALGMQPDLECVAVAHTARSGLVTAAATDFAVALVDLQLPDGGGLALVPRLLELRPAARIIVLTGHPRADLAERATSAGAAAFLGKDVPLGSILDAMRSAHPAHPLVDTRVSLTRTRVALTHREHDVLRELAMGRDATHIAEALEISLFTTRDHIKSILGKLGVHSQLDAVVSAQRLGLVTVGSRY